MCYSYLSTHILPPWLDLFLGILYWFIFGCPGSSLCSLVSCSCGSGGYSWLCCMDFSWWWLLLWSTGCRHRASVVAARGLRGCRVQAWGRAWCSSWQHTGSVVRHSGLVAPWRVESSWTRDQTHVSCISRQIPIHSTTREALFYCILM